MMTSATRDRSSRFYMSRGVSPPRRPETRLISPASRLMIPRFVDGKDIRQNNGPPPPRPPRRHGVPPQVVTKQSLRPTLVFNDLVPERRNRHRNRKHTRTPSPRTSPGGVHTFYEGKYKCEDGLGMGSFGTVYRAYVDTERKQFALKYCTMRSGREPRSIEELEHTVRSPHPAPTARLSDYEREIYALSLFSAHPSIVNLCEHFPAHENTHRQANGRQSSPQRYVIVLDFVHFNLSTILKTHLPQRGYSEWETHHLLKQLLVALDHIHRNDVIHSDLKPDNILVDRNACIKVADFGISQFLSFEQSLDGRRKRSSIELNPEPCTIWYRPPEAFLGYRHYDTGLDIWSFGIILLEMLIGNNPMSRINKENIFALLWDWMGYPPRNIFSDDIRLAKAVNQNLPALLEKPTYDTYLKWLAQPRMNTPPPTIVSRYGDKLPPLVLDILQRIFIYDPHDRPSAAALLETEWFSLHGDDLSDALPPSNEGSRSGRHTPSSAPALSRSQPDIRRPRSDGWSSSHSSSSIGSAESLGSTGPMKRSRDFYKSPRYLSSDESPSARLGRSTDLRGSWGGTLPPSSSMGMDRDFLNRPLPYRWGAHRSSPSARADGIKRKHLNQLSQRHNAVRDEHEKIRVVTLCQRFYFARASQ